MEAESDGGPAEHPPVITMQVRSFAVAAEQLAVEAQPSSPVGRSDGLMKTARLQSTRVPVAGLFADAGLTA